MAHLFTDADNTLWDTNAVFIEAQLGLLRALEQRVGQSAPPSHDRGLAFLRAIDQRLARKHPDHLRYPPHLLVAGLLSALQGASAGRAAEAAFSAEPQTDYDAEIGNYVTAIKGLPALRDGVRETLARAQKLGIRVTVVTEEKAERVFARLGSHNLEHFVEDVVSALKSVHLFKELRQRAPDDRCIMVGDQPDRDIGPAKRAGYECYFYPGDFTPFWAKRSKVPPDGVLKRFDELIPILEGARAGT